MVQRLAFNSFGKGILSPYMLGRIDTEMYYSGAEILSNLIVRTTGQPVRRAGTKYARRTNTTGITRNLPFIIDANTSYVFETYEYVFKLRDSSGIEIILDLDAVGAWAALDEYSEGDIVKHTSAVPNTDYYICVGDHVSAISAELGLEALWYRYDLATDETGEWPIELTTPYTSAQVLEINHAQKEDVLNVVHPLHPPSELRRYGDNQWAFLDDQITGPPWETINEDKEIELNLESRTVGDTILKVMTGQDFFTADDVGRHFRIGGTATSGDYEGEQGYCIVNSQVPLFETEKVNVTVIRECSIGSKTSEWSRDAFYVDNYPAYVTYHESRLVLAGAPDAEQKTHHSRPFIYRDFNYLDEDEGGFSLELDTAHNNPIRWLSSGEGLAVGTFGGEFISKSPSDGAMDESNKNSRLQSSWGSEPIAPVKMGNRLYYVQRGGRKIREFFYTFDYDNYDSPDMTKYADHITESGVLGMAYQRNPDSLLWCWLDNGEMITLSRDPDSDVQAWTTWETDGLVKDLVFLPRPGEEADRGVAIIQREINGETVQYVEYFDSHVIEPGTAREDFYHVDCGVTQDSDFHEIFLVPYYEETKGNLVSVTANPNPHVITQTLDNDLLVQKTSVAWINPVTGLADPHVYVTCDVPYFVASDYVTPVDTELYIIDTADGTMLNSARNFEVGTTENFWGPLTSTNGRLSYFDSTFWFNGGVAHQGGTWGRFDGTVGSAGCIECPTDTGDFILDPTLDYFVATDADSRVFTFNDEDGVPIFAVVGVWFFPAYDDSGIHYPARLGVNKTGIPAVVEGDYEGGQWGGSTSELITPPNVDETTYEVWNNLSHLEGETVDITKDGIYVGQDVVLGGEIDESLIAGYTTAAIGLPITSILKTVAINTKTPLGTAKGAVRRINGLSVDLFRSRALEYSEDGTNYFTLGTPEWEEQDEEFTGLVPNLTFLGPYDYDGWVWLKQSIPYPMNILGIYPEVEVTSNRGG